MTDYKKIAASLGMPTQCFIDGKPYRAHSGAVFETRNPANGDLLATLPFCASVDVDVAVASARRVFEAGDWSAQHPSARKAILCKLADLIDANTDELAVMETLDAGKPIADCAAIDVPETAACIRWHAEAQDKIYDQIAPSAPDAIGLIVREPIGVVAAVLPWNFPLMMMAWKIGPALATGNSVIVKPAEQTSLTAIRIAELALAAGVPPGVLNVITGMGPVVGEPLGRHMDVDALTFTGSTATGRRFLEYAAQSNMKECCLEMGGKSAAVILQDAGDIDAIAKIQANAIFWNMGENCTANSRIIVHKDRYDELVSAMVKQAGTWKMGDPLDPDTQNGPLISDEHMEKVAGLVQSGKAAGARVAYGGERGKGLLFQPTVFADVTRDMEIFNEEIFGPVVAITKANSDDEAVELANATAYGLAATLYTRDIAKAHRYARKLKAGTVGVNAYSEGEISTPFGGFKASGFGGRDNGIHAHEQYTELKTIWINLDG
ncbi:aldehyde dehydrogenase associated with polyamine-utilization [Octadecabacter antarcticus 307]|uniref:Aldehyde dehydrogenase associated with polyamine-utilization n=1 Tax=Octadecabacter antarcticus 307 TaxID=391626 RepID=M9RIM7_9RHOB|nr:aldehyde dehydrogenase [Octadecabacter antarcticus]AGI69690.1 aldehyde dehydrogenase associated with polyamine-utilization [Octadecabacter antarcticus 307]